MHNDLIKIVQLISEGIFNIWPYLVLTIPISVLVHVTEASKYINRALNKNPQIAILMAIVVGAFSPFCSCGVIPIIASLLISGVPLAPIMAFWVASPSMDPEIFFLSVGMLGWNLAIWRLISTFILSLSAGYLTKYLEQKRWFGDNILISNKNPKVKTLWKTAYNYYKSIFYSHPKLKPVLTIYDGSMPELPHEVSLNDNYQTNSELCCYSIKPTSVCGSKCDNDKIMKQTLWKKTYIETMRASILVLKFMSLAFFVKALITLYVPDTYVLALLGQNNFFSVIISTIIGIPFYTSNLTALPTISGFIEQGMDQGAALAFLIAGPVTTIPALAAVWGITNKKVFIIYLAIPLMGSVLFGYLFKIFN